MPKSKISKPEVKQPRVVLRSSAAEILSAYDKQIYSVEQAAQMLGLIKSKSNFHGFNFSKRSASRSRRFLRVFRLV